MGASLALAGVTACTRQPAEKIVPYVRQPEEIVPGRPLFFATAMTLGGVATGLLVESHEGRPTKIEGNPQHPGSLGATDIFAQAAVLGLVRSRPLADADEPRRDSSRGRDSSARFARCSRAQQPLQGSGLRLLTESISSPTLAAQIRDLLGRYPAAQVASMGSREPRQRPRGREARIRRIRRLPVPLRSRRRRSSRSTPTSSAPAPAASATPATSPRAAVPDRRRAHEPAVCDREHADLDRRARGSSPAGAAGRHRSHRSRHRHDRARPVGVAGVVSDRAIALPRANRHDSGSRRSRRIFRRIADRAS